jgi:sulfhydrogenase subunit delta
MTGLPTLAVWKFASCDGCQLTLLDCEDELLTLAGQVKIAHFLEASSAPEPGPYDLSLVEGSITTRQDEQRIRQVRERSKVLVTIGACATAGGIQALRNFGDVDEFRRAVYASPQYIDTLATSTPISSHVPVDFELRGCPIDKRQLIEVISAFLVGRRRTSQTRASAPNASDAGSPASWLPTAPPASVRLRTPAVAPCAQRSVAAATAASVR